jgi:hypothetical protein
VIVRIWHGWTASDNADAYEGLPKGDVFVGIGDRNIHGYHGIRLLRRTVGKEVEFVTIMTFDDLDAVRQFAGEDYAVAVVPPKARALLARFDQRSQHYELRVERPGLSNGESHWPLGGPSEPGLSRTAPRRGALALVDNARRAFNHAEEALSMG